MGVWLFSLDSYVYTSIVKMFDMFDRSNSKFSEFSLSSEHNNMVKTVMLALLMIFLCFILLIFVIGFVYALLIYSIKLFRMLCCALCHRSNQKNAPPPPYDSLCNYFYFFIKHFISSKNSYTFLCKFTRKNTIFWKWYVIFNYQLIPMKDVYVIEKIHCKNKSKWLI